MIGVRGAVLGLAVTLVWLAMGHGAFAYTASGDRQFATTLVLPQLTPGDEVYFNYQMQPLHGGGPGTPDRTSNFTLTYLKTITEDLGISIDETYTRNDLVGGGANYGWQNLDGALKYVAYNDPAHEFITTLGLDRETGGTGATRVGASPSGATTPQVFFGKGLGDLDIGYLRPLAVTGFGGVQLADTAPRPDLVLSGFAIEYSIPYLESKVQSVDLPDIVRHVTPITEISLSSPAGRSYGAHTTALFAPGVSYAGEGWELAVEALVPASRATGSGVGVTAQLTIALDFLFPESIGKPLFSSP